jgi:hypothetical protein
MPCCFSNELLRIDFEAGNSRLRLPAKIWAMSEDGYPMISVRECPKFPSREAMKNRGGI